MAADSQASISYPGSAAEQLLLAPQELRTADPSFATEIYNGHFGLAGRLAELTAESPFEIVPPSEGWEPTSPNRKWSPATTRALGPSAGKSG